MRGARGESPRVPARASRRRTAAARRYLRADPGGQRDDDLLAVAFVQEREQLEPAFVLPQIDGDRGVGEHARKVGVTHVAIDHQRRDTARHEPIDERLRDERFADAALIAVEEVDAHVFFERLRDFVERIASFEGGAHLVLYLPIASAIENALGAFGFSGSAQAALRRFANFKRRQIEIDGNVCGVAHPKSVDELTLLRRLCWKKGGERDRPHKAARSN